MSGFATSSVLPCCVSNMKIRPLTKSLSNQIFFLVQLIIGCFFSKKQVERLPVALALSSFGASGITEESRQRHCYRQLTISDPTDRADEHKNSEVFSLCPETIICCAFVLIDTSNNMSLQCQLSYVYKQQIKIITRSCQSMLGDLEVNFQSEKSLQFLVSVHFSSISNQKMLTSAFSCRSMFNSPIDYFFRHSILFVLTE